MSVSVAKSTGAIPKGKHLLSLRVEGSSVANGGASLTYDAPGVLGGTTVTALAAMYAVGAPVSIVHAAANVLAQDADLTTFQTNVTVSDIGGTLELTLPDGLVNGQLVQVNVLVATGTIEVHFNDFLTQAPVMHALVTASDWGLYQYRTDLGLTGWTLVETHVHQP